jgi:hypothetical protein
LFVLGAGVAELADAQDLGFSASPLLKPAHRYTNKNTAYLACRTDKAEAFSRLLILIHGEVIDKLKNQSGETGRSSFALPFFTALLVAAFSINAECALVSIASSFWWELFSVRLHFREFSVFVFFPRVDE